jgi:hypothetical protein
VGVGLMVFQQLGGINALGFYTSYIFSSAGIQMPIFFATSLKEEHSVIILPQNFRVFW